MASAYARQALLMNRGSSYTQQSSRRQASGSIGGRAGSSADRAERQGHTDRHDRADRFDIHDRNSYSTRSGRSHHPRSSNQNINHHPIMAEDDDVGTMGTMNSGGPIDGSIHVPDNNSMEFKDYSQVTLSQMSPSELSNHNNENSVGSMGYSRQNHGNCGTASSHAGNAGKSNRSSSVLGRGGYRSNQQHLSQQSQSRHHERRSIHEHMSSGRSYSQPTSQSLSQPLPEDRDRGRRGFQMYEDDSGSVQSSQPMLTPLPRPGSESSMRTKQDSTQYHSQHQQQQVEYNRQSSRSSSVSSTPRREKRARLGIQSSNSVDRRVSEERAKIAAISNAKKSRLANSTSSRSRSHQPNSLAMLPPPPKSLTQPSTLASTLSAGLRTPLRSFSALAAKAAKFSAERVKHSTLSSAQGVRTRSASRPWMSSTMDALTTPLHRMRSARTLTQSAPSIAPPITSASSSHQLGSSQTQQNQQNDQPQQIQQNGQLEALQNKEQQNQQNETGKESPKTIKILEGSPGQRECVLTSYDDDEGKPSQKVQNERNEEIQKESPTTIRIHSASPGQRECLLTSYDDEGEGSASVANGAPVENGASSKVSQKTAATESSTKAEHQINGKEPSASKASDHMEENNVNANNDEDSEDDGSVVECSARPHNASLFSLSQVDSQADSQGNESKSMGMMSQQGKSSSFSQDFQLLRTQESAIDHKKSQAEEKFLEKDQEMHEEQHEEQEGDASVSTFSRSKTSSVRSDAKSSRGLVTLSQQQYQDIMSKITSATKQMEEQQQMLAQKQEEISKLMEQAHDGMIENHSKLQGWTSQMDSTSEQHQLKLRNLVNDSIKEIQAEKDHAVESQTKALNAEVHEMIKTEARQSIMDIVNGVITTAKSDFQSFVSGFKNAISFGPSMAEESNGIVSIDSKDDRHSYKTPDPTVNGDRCDEPQSMNSDNRNDVISAATTPFSSKTTPRQNNCAKNRHRVPASLSSQKEIQSTDMMTPMPLQSDNELTAEPLVQSSSKNPVSAKSSTRSVEKTPSSGANENKKEADKKTSKMRPKKLSSQDLKHRISAVIPPKYITVTKTETPTEKPKRSSKKSYGRRKTPVKVEQTPLFDSANKLDCKKSFKMEQEPTLDSSKKTELKTPTQKEKKPTLASSTKKPSLKRKPTSFNEVKSPRRSKRLRESKLADHRASVAKLENTEMKKPGRKTKKPIQVTPMEEEVPTPEPSMQTPAPREVIRSCRSYSSFTVSPAQKVSEVKYGKKDKSSSKKRKREENLVGSEIAIDEPKEEVKVEPAVPIYLGFRSRKQKKATSTKRDKKPRGIFETMSSIFDFKF